jgi:hypothetical protein
LCGVEIQTASGRSVTGAALVRRPLLGS